MPQLMSVQPASRLISLRCTAGISVGQHGIVFLGEKSLGCRNQALAAYHASHCGCGKQCVFARRSRLLYSERF
jgi:hypothetical protein